MGNARCVLMPTLYVEPFGLVAIEAQMCGTPAITTDWGAFPETVEQGVSGYRCHTLREFCDAVWESPRLDRDVIRKRAIDLYSTESIGPQYVEFFNRLETLKGKGWYD
jgi:glycosyltransferase involved in cell wall biosynthesis